MSDNQAVKNTDREIWRGPDEGNGSYYADSIHVTEQGGIGIDVGGLVFVKPVREWHKLAAQDWPPRVEGSSAGAPAASPPDAAQVLLAGTMMANAMYNLSQRGEMTDNIRSQMRIMQQEWDKAATAYRAAPPARSAASTVEPVAPKVSLVDDEVLIEWIAPGHHVVISIEEDDGVGYAYREGDKFFPGRFKLGTKAASEHIKALLALFPAAPTTSPEPDAVRSDLTTLAAECHRAKWQFDLSDEHKIAPGETRQLIAKAFKELHRIGDLALKSRSALSRPAHGGWEDISTAPKDGTELLLDYDGVIVIASFRRHYDEWRTASGDDYIPTKRIRGWMRPPLARNHGEGGGPRS